MPEVFLRLQAAAGHEGIGNADGGSAAECGSGVKRIIPLQKGTVNDAEDIVLVIVPIPRRQPDGDVLQLIGEALPGWDLKHALQRRRHRVQMLRPVLPEVGVQPIVHAASIGNIEHIAQDRSAPAVVNEGDALRAAPDVAAHPLVPEIIFRAGSGVGPLGVDHQLLREGVFIEPPHRCQKRRPRLIAAHNLPRGIVRQLERRLELIRHRQNPPGQNQA